MCETSFNNTIYSIKGFHLRTLYGTQDEPGKNPQCFGYKFFNYQPEHSMAESHAKKAREKIAQKKAKDNVKKLELLVDELQGKMESQETVNLKNDSKQNCKSKNVVFNSI